MSRATTDQHTALQRRIAELTPLNRSTSRRYDACHGKHVPSGDTITRAIVGLDRMLPICRTCGVPYGAPVHHWSSSRGGQA
jgi:hypothetical protein